MTIAVVSFKGGVGKTTTAVHLAAALYRNRAPVALIDGDPNQSATRWAARGPGFPFTILADTRDWERRMREYTHTVVDTEARPGMRDLGLLSEQCDRLVLPTIPDAISLDATLIMAQALTEARLKNWAVLLTCVPPPGGAAKDAFAELRNRSIPSLRNWIPRLVAFNKAQLAGVTVEDVKDPRAVIGANAYRRLGKELLYA